jgi:hypothetical protein
MGFQASERKYFTSPVFEDAKGEVGLDHFEVRSYRALMRHLVLTALSLYFLCEETNRLRKKNPYWTPSQVRDAVEVQLDPARSSLAL